MDPFQAFLNLVVPPMAFSILIVMWPALGFRSLVMRFIRALFAENLRGKTVILTGASSHLGEAIAYRYARKGAILVLVAPSEDKIRAVADQCKRKGAMDTQVIRADASQEDDCRQFIEDTVNKYGRLDHLVINAAVPQGFLFDEARDTSRMRKIMMRTCTILGRMVVVIHTVWLKQGQETKEIDFWSYVYPTFYALQHLKRSKGKIVVNASVLSWMPFARLTINSAVKAAIFQFFETLRIELGPSIGGITIVTAGWIESDMTAGKFINSRGLQVDGDHRDLQVGPVPVAYADECAKAVVRGVVRSQRYVRFPQWYTVFLLFRVFAPEALDFLLHVLYVTPAPGRKDGATLSKVIMEIPGMKCLLYPASIRNVRRHA